MELYLRKSLPSNNYRPVDRISLPPASRAPCWAGLSLVYVRYPKSGPSECGTVGVSEDNQPGLLPAI
jgi:hypothetical protein